MELIISGRHFEVDDELKALAEAKMQRLEGEYPKLTSARVVMKAERNWRVVELHINGKQMNLNAHVQTTDMGASVDAAFEKVERQLRRQLERMQEHRAPAREGVPEAVEDAEDDVDDTAEWELEIPAES